jgi:hypothetical protein
MLPGAPSAPHPRDGEFIAGLALASDFALKGHGSAVPFSFANPAASATEGMFSQNKTPLSAGFLIPKLPNSRIPGMRRKHFVHDRMQQPKRRIHQHRPARRRLQTDPATAALVLPMLHFHSAFRTYQNHNGPRPRYHSLHFSGATPKPLTISPQLI